MHAWRGLKIYETILKQTEAEKLTADVIQTESTELIKRLSEKEFETQFESVCTAVHEAIKVNPDGINSPFLKKLIEENKDYIAYGTTIQSGKNGNSQSETETGNADTVQPKSTGLGD